MSNTIRRKTIKVPKGWFTRRVYLEGYSCGKEVTRQGRDWFMQHVCWHTDKFQPWETHVKQDEKPFRRNAKHEVKKAINDPEYEVQVVRMRG